MAAQGKYISLPPMTMATDGQSLEKLLQQRRSIREFGKVPVNLAILGQLLWAAQGISHPQGLRTAPSAGALYPLELYVVAGEVEGLPSAVYHYLPEGHRLLETVPGDRRQALARTALDQSWLSDAAVIVVFTAIYARTTCKYGDRGVRYVHMEVGHAAQNLFLQAEAETLGSVVVGAFQDDEVSKVLELPADTQPLTLMPVGRYKGA
jgi:SagB-type dehydrogenase family enzyme